MAEPKVKKAVEYLADVLNAEMAIYQPNGVPKKLLFSVPKKVPIRIASNLKFPVLLGMKASWVSQASGVAAILFRVRGDLYMYMVADPGSKWIYAMLLDADKMPMTEKVLKAVEEQPPLKMMLALVKYGAVVEVFRAKYNEVFKGWESYEVDTLVERLVAATGQAVGAAASTG